ncbi:MAG: DUF6056 family protein [Anaerolineaceae bacterium]|nr:DUF6056 family protein [Anaerolineaceae bacterium]
MGANLEQEWAGKPGRLAALLYGLGGLAFLLPLGVFALTGFQTRYWADDYCFSAALKTDGFWQAQVSFYQSTSDRYAVLPLIGISEWFGEHSIQILPGLVIVLFLAAVTWLLWELRTALQLSFSRGMAFLLAGMGVFFVLLQAPNRFQVLYWRSGLLTYLMPLVTISALAAWILYGRRAYRAKRLWPYLTAIFLFAFLSAGFSETSTVMQAAGLFLGLAALLWRRQLPGRGTALWLAFAALAGTLLGIAVLLLSPSVWLRQAHFAAPPGAFALALTSLRYGLDFALDTFKTQPLPVAVSLAGPALAAFTLPRGGRMKMPLAQAGLAGVGVVLLGLLLVVSAIVPSVFAQSAYPEGRALIVPRFVLTGTTMAVGWIAGRVAAAYLLTGRASRPLRLLAALALGLLFLYPLRSAYLNLAEVQTSQARAVAWDERHASIQAAIAAGDQRLHVAGMDSVAGLMELGPDPDMWVNHCAAGFYGIESIQTDE